MHRGNESAVTVLLYGSRAMFASLIEFVNTYIFGPGLCAAVFISGIILICILRPFFITKPRKMTSALKSGGSSEGLSPSKAMLVALAGTLGVGNIAGVASAIAIGGAGAVLWMLVSAVAALPLKYAEIVLAVRHRRRDKSGRAHGGAYFYIADRGGKTATAFAGIFAVLCLAASLTMGCATQANAIAVSVDSAFGVPPLICGLILGILTLTVASGGLERIAFITTRLIPLMSGIYILMSLYVILTNLPLVWEVTTDIVESAFDIRSFGGGIMGFVTSRALRIGVTRGIVSNEAGCGTAPIAHAGAEVTVPAAQGVWGMFEVFVDTIVICTLTALAVLIAGKQGTAIVSDGMVTAISAFGAFIPFAEQVLSTAVIIFAFCTIVCWFYYGSESLVYLCGRRRGVWVKLYLVIYSVCAVLGAVSTADMVWGLSDLAISIMTAVNVTAVLLSVKEVKRETERYFYSEQCHARNNDIIKKQ